MNKSDYQLFWLNDFGLIKVTGADAAKFLQGQLTCDVTKASDRSLLLGAHCNPQGRMISMFHLFYWRESYFLLLPRALCDIALKALQKYVVFFKATLTNFSTNFSIIGQRGQRKKILHENFIELPFDQSRQLLVSDLPTLAAVSEKLAHPIEESANAWHLQNLLLGIPRLYTETSQILLPQEINLPELNGVSFSKGCFTGQEIIARLHYKGKLKKKLYRCQIKTLHKPAPGSFVYYDNNHGKTVSAGLIVDSCQDNALVQALILLDDDKTDKLLFCDREQEYFKILSVASETRSIS